MEKAAKIIMASVMSSIIIISGVSFFALDFTDYSTTGTAGMSDQAKIDDKVSASTYDSASSSKSLSLNLEELASIETDSQNVPVSNNDDSPPVKMITATNIGRNSDDVVGEAGPGSRTQFWPQRSLTFPDTVKVGEEFDVIMDYSFIIPSVNDDEFGIEFLDYVEPERICTVEECGDLKIRVSLNESVDLVNRDDYVFEGNFTNTQYAIHLSSQYGWVTVPFNNALPQQEVFTLKINEPTVDYRFGTIFISYATFMDDGTIYFYVGPDNTVHLSDKEISVPGEGPSQLAEATPYYAPRNASETKGDVPDRFLPDYAEFLREHYAHVDIGQLLRNENFTEPFIDKFFRLYPDLKPQAFIPSMHWILPQAFAQSTPPSFSFVYGNLKYYDSSSTLSILGNAKICAFDTENGKLTPLYNGQTQVCEFSSSDGSFRLHVPTMDPNGSGGADLVLKAYSESPNVVVYKNNNQNMHSISGSSPITNLTDSIHNYGDFTLPKYQISNKAFWVIHELNSIRDWYQSELDVSAPKAYAIWDPEKCSGVGIDPSSKIMALEDTQKIVVDMFKDCPSTISPLKNTDTLAHEYAHIQFYHSYDSKNSDYPDYAINHPSGYHSPVHPGNSAGTAWVEGWAFFIAAAYSGSPTYQPAYMEGQWNFEDRTHNEVTDIEFKNKPFVSGFAGEGGVAAALYDLIDTTNEPGDNQQDQLRNIWNVMNDDLEFDETIIAADFGEFKNDWDDEKLPNIDSVFQLNELANVTPVTHPNNNNSDMTIFSDTFDNLDAWTREGESDWRVGIPDEGGHPPDHPVTNIVAETDDCDNECMLVLTNSLDLTSYSAATLSLYRYVDNSLDSGEYLRIDVSSNGGTSWSNILTWAGGIDDDDTWHKETFDLASYLGSSDFKVRAVAKASSSSEDLVVDSLKILGIKKSVTSDAIFTDDFESGFSKWTLSAEDDDEWEIQTVQRQERHQVTKLRSHLIVIETATWYLIAWTQRVKTPNCRFIGLFLHPLTMLRD